MALTNEQNYNLNSGYGRMLANAVAAQVPTFGRILIVAGATTDNNYPRLNNMFKPYAGRVHMYAGSDALSTAITEAETQSNDVILLDGQSTHTVTSGIALTKNRLNFIGMDGGDRIVQQGAKVQLATAATTAYVLKNTGTRNSFRNIKFIQAATAATGLHVLEDGSEGALYKNCSFVFGVVDNLDLTTATEALVGTDSANFIDCLFGTETLLTSAARAVFTIDQVTASQEFKSNIIRNCVFMISSSSATAYLVKLAANTDVLFTNLFDRCMFMASVDSAGGIALTNAVTSAASTVKGTVNFYMPGSFNCTNFSANDSTAFRVYAAATSTNAFEAGTPA